MEYERTTKGSEVDYYSFEITQLNRRWVIAIVDNDPDRNGDDAQTGFEVIVGSLVVDTTLP